MTRYRGIAWLASRADGIGHAQPDRGRPIRTVCGERAIDPRFAWPERRRCVACVQLVAEKLAGVGSSQSPSTRLAMCTGWEFPEVRRRGLQSIPAQEPARDIPESPRLLQTASRVGRDCQDGPPANFRGADR
jgi:hypothetical protein